MQQYKQVQSYYNHNPRIPGTNLWPWFWWFFETNRITDIAPYVHTYFSVTILYTYHERTQVKEYMARRRIGLIRIRNPPGPDRVKIKHYCSSSDFCKYPHSTPMLFCIKQLNYIFLLSLSFFMLYNDFFVIIHWKHYNRKYFRIIV